MEEGDVVHPHSPCSLEEGLHQQAVELVVVSAEGLLQSGNGGGDMDHVGAGTVGLEDEVVVLVVADLHRLEGVAVVGVLQGQNQGALGFSPVHVVLQGHFQGHLHRHAARVGEEGVVQIAGEKLPQLFCQPESGLVGEAAQHHVGELLHLLNDGPVELRVLVAVDHAPPGGHRVDEFPVRGVEVDPLGVGNEVGRGHGFQLLIGIPDHKDSSCGS